MPLLVGRHQQTPFSTPQPNTTALAEEVLGNDNSLTGVTNLHDADPTYHIQSGLVSERPGAGTLGRVFIAHDAGVPLPYFDTGSAWVLFGFATLGHMHAASTIAAGTFPAGAFAFDGTVEFKARAFLSHQGNVKRYSAGDSGAAPAVNWNNGNWQVWRLTADATPVFTNPVVGADYRLELYQDGTGGRTLTLSGATFIWTAGAAPTFTTTANRKDVLLLSCISAAGGGTYLASVVALNLNDTTA